MSLIIAPAVTLLPSVVPADDKNAPSPFVIRTGTGDEAIDTLMEMADPMSDDWETERMWTRCKGPVGKLLVELAAPDAKPEAISTLLSESARASSLLPSALDERSYAGGIRVRDAGMMKGAQDRTHSAQSALEDLFGSLHRDRWKLRVEYKIVAVTEPAERSWKTETRVEIFGIRDRETLQQTAYWNIGWTSGPNSENPRIQSIDLLSFQEAHYPATPFRDCTTSLLGTGEMWTDQLLLGADYWYGNMDAVGEINFLGHNGFALCDVNGDGREDVYVAMGTGLPNKLLVQNPDGTLTDKALEAGVAWLDDTKGVLLADMDNDSDQDLLCAIGPTIVLCKNDGTGKFGPFIGMRSPTAAAFYSLAAADYDLDGDLDIYGCRYVYLRYGTSMPIPFHDANNGPPNHLLRNDGNDRFTDVTAEVGLEENNRRFSLAAAWIDFDNDGDPDLYVANDFGRNNLYRNDGGRFTDIAAAAGVEDQAAGMGVAWSDYDLDGDFDLYVSNMFSSAGRRIAYQPRFHQDLSSVSRIPIQRHSWGNTLMKNQGDGTFTDVSEEAGVRLGRWAWGSKFIDLNNDGLDDLVVPNGFLTNARKDDL